MTIAACHLCPEGAILGADSMSSIVTADGDYTFNLDYEQKIFEVGDTGSTVGLATWGEGRFGVTSHRTIAAQLGEAQRKFGFSSFEAMAERLMKLVDTACADAVGGKDRWEELKQAYLRLRQGYFDHTESQESDSEYPNWDDLWRLHNLFRGGYFLAGRLEQATHCTAYEVAFGLQATVDKIPIRRISHETPNFRGVPNVMQRLVKGYDEELVRRIMRSGKWSGSMEELVDVLDVPDKFRVKPELLPFRDAVDWVHTVIHTTIRGMKFAGERGCGGPVEVATISTDRPFRWVCHKPLGAAIITVQEGHGR